MTNNNKIKHWFSRIQFRQHITMRLFLGLILNFGFFLFTFNSTDLLIYKITSIIWWFIWYTFLILEPKLQKEKETQKPSKIRIIEDLFRPIREIESMAILSNAEKEYILKNQIQNVIDIWAYLREQNYFNDQ